MKFENVLGSQVLVLDGAMGTMVQNLELDDAAFGGDNVGLAMMPLYGGGLVVACFADNVGESGTCVWVSECLFGVVS